MTRGHDSNAHEQLKICMDRLINEVAMHAVRRSWSFSLPSLEWKIETSCKITIYDFARYFNFVKKINGSVRT
jgi:hypothetical protein